MPKPLGHLRPDTLNAGQASRQTREESRNPLVQALAGEHVEHRVAELPSDAASQTTSPVRQVGDRRREPAKRTADIHLQLRPGSVHPAEELHHPGLERLASRCLMNTLQAVREATHSSAARLVGGAPQIAKNPASISYCAPEVHERLDAAVNDLL